MSIVDIDVAQEQVTTSEVIIYTASSSSTFQSAKITGGVCSNPTSNDAQLTINIVQFGGSADTTNQYLPPKFVYKNSYDLLSSIAGAGITLKSGDFIVTKSSLASTLNLKLSITEKYTDT